MSDRRLPVAFGSDIASVVSVVAAGRELQFVCIVFDFIIASQGLGIFSAVFYFIYPKVIYHYQSALFILIISEDDSFHFTFYRDGRRYISASLQYANFITKTVCDYISAALYRLLLLNCTKHFIHTVLPILLLD